MLENLCTICAFPIAKKSTFCIWLYIELCAQQHLRMLYPPDNPSELRTTWEFEELEYPEQIKLIAAVRDLIDTY